MWRFAIFYLLINTFVLIAASNSHDANTGKRNWKVDSEQDIIRRKRTFGSSEPPCNMSNGVYLEKWERIDYKRIRFLLEDPRYPNLPSFTMCVSKFEQPSNWGDFFGTRLRTYFVPFQSGNHYFFLSSNAGSELFLSTNSSAMGKTLISEIDGGFPSKQYEYDRFVNQKSLPVSLEKGHYYYMEAIMKDDHQEDHLEVGLQTPDGKFYHVIPSQFLWTTLHLSAAENFRHQAILIKVAAKAGASAGSSVGERWAMKTGAEAGAKAGALAGMEAGASSGAAAGEKAAIEMTTKTIEDALNSLHGDNLHKYSIIFKNGSVVAVTGPGMDGASEGAALGAPGAVGGEGAGVRASGVGGKAGAEGIPGAGGKAGAAVSSTGGGRSGATTGAGTVSVGVSAGMGAEQAGGVGAGAGAGQAAGAGGGAGAGAATGAGAGAGTAVVGGGGTNTVGGVLAGGSASGIVTGSAGTAAGSLVGGAVSRTYSSHRDVTYIPRPGEDPQSVARALVWRVGGATKLVDKGLYTVHSFDIPFQQENGTLNFCWQAHNGDLALRQFCQVFKARIPGFYKGVEDRDRTVSFESVCLPGYFVRQKNYNFILEKRDGTGLFDKDSSFSVYSVMKLSRNLMLQSMHKDWYVCQTKKSSRHDKTNIILDFYDGKPDVLHRCTFLFHPIAQYENKYKMCKNVIGPVKHPAIVGQPLPNSPHLVPKTPPPPPALPSCIPVCQTGTLGGSSEEPGIAGPSAPVIPAVATTAKMCVALNFINNFGSSFKLYSSLKHEGYLVTGLGFKLKLIIDRPELHSHVTFFAEDPSGGSKLLLNEAPSISEPAVYGCPEFLTVYVTSDRGITPGASLGGVSAALSPQSPPNTPSLAVSQPPAPPSPHLYGAHPPHPPPVYSPPAAAPASAVLPTVRLPAAAPVAPHPTTSGETASHGDHQAVHYHYHYHGHKALKTAFACPSICSKSEECHPSCPSYCCKRQKVLRSDHMI